MDYEGFLKRLSPQVIAKFLIYGDQYAFSSTEFDLRSLEIRIEDYCNIYSEKLEKIKDIELQEELIIDIGNSEDAYFEWGLMAGLMMAKW